MAELVELTVKLGDVDAAELRMKEIEGRHIGGSAGARVRMGREGLWVLQNRHDLVAASGTLALEMILRDRNPEPYRLPAALATYHPRPDGTSLTELRGLARRSGLGWRMAYRTDRQAEFVVPSVVHLQTGHYSALVRHEGDKYLLRDPIFGGNLWVSRDALVYEASGYALVPGDALRADWRDVEDVVSNSRLQCGT